MTVIAYKDGVMAADTQLFPSGHRTNKLVRMPDGSVVGAAGSWAACYAGLSWFAGGGSLDGRGEGQPPDIDDAEFLIARPDGTLWVAEGRFPAYPLLDKCTAIGSGEDFARAWMDEGHSALEAVAKVAAKSPGCGFPVQTMVVEQPREFSGASTFTKLPKPARKPAKRRK